MERRGLVPLPALRGASVGHDPSPSCLPVSRLASRWRCSGVRLATRSARGSAVVPFAVSSFLVQPVVQPIEEEDVTPDRLSLAIDRSLPPELEVAGSNPAGHTKPRKDLRRRVGGECRKRPGDRPVSLRRRPSLARMQPPGRPIHPFPAARTARLAGAFIGKTRRFAVPYIDRRRRSGAGWPER